MGYYPQHFGLPDTALCGNLPAAIITQCGSNSVANTLKYSLRALLAALLLMTAGACVYEVDVQQGNKLEPQDVEAVEVGMSRNQVRYILGTPVVSNLFNDSRWDYVYYFRKGRSKNPERRWLIVRFEGDTVVRIDRDLMEQPADEAA